MDFQMSRRRILEAVVVQVAGMPVYAHSANCPAEEVQRLRECFAHELERRLGLTPWNAQAMGARAFSLLDQPAAVLLGDSCGETVEIVESGQHRRPWRVRADQSCDVSLSNAVGLATRFSAAAASTGASSLRWFSSCTFGGATGHVLRQARGTVFLVTIGACQVAPKRIDFG